MEEFIYVPALAEVDETSQTNYYIPYACKKEDLIVGDHTFSFFETKEDCQKYIDENLNQSLAVKPLEIKNHTLFTDAELELFQSLFGMERIRLGFHSGKTERYEHSYLRQGFRYWESKDVQAIQHKVMMFNSKSEKHMIVITNYIDGEDEYDMDRSYPASFNFIVEPK